MARLRVHEPKGCKGRAVRFDDDPGATAAEYAILATLIAVAIVTAVTAMGLSLEVLFSDPQLADALT